MPPRPAIWTVRAVLAENLPVRPLPVRESRRRTGVTATYVEGLTVGGGATDPTLNVRVADVDRTLPEPSSDLTRQQYAPSAYRLIGAHDVMTVVTLSVSETNPHVGAT